MYKMKASLNSWSLLILLVLFCFNLPAQVVSKEDYRRAESFLWDNLVNKKVFNIYLTAEYFPDSTGMWLLEFGKDKKDFYRISFDRLRKEPLFDQQRLADSLHVMLGDTIAANKLPFDRVNPIAEDSLVIRLKNKDYLLNLKDYTITLKQEEKNEGATNRSTSPDGKWEAFTKDYNLFLRSTETGEEFQLSADGRKYYEYGTYYGWGDLIEGENGDRPDRFSVSWSEDSKWLETNLCDLRDAEKMYLLDYSIDTLYRPKLLSYYRASPGDTTIVKMVPKIYNVELKKEAPVRLPFRTYINQYITWILEDSRELLVCSRHRGFQKLDFLKFDLITGKKEHLFSETSTTNIDGSFGFYPLEKLRQFTFLSERTGWKQLYIYDLKTGQLNRLTKGDFIVHRIVHRDQEKGDIYFLASGVNANDNPYYQYLYKIPIAGGEMHCLTPEPGNHAIRFSPDGRFFIDEWSEPHQATKFLLRTAESGENLMELVQTDVSWTESIGWKPAESFTAIARDQKTTIYGALWKPTNFDSKKKYPVIDYSYTGPHTQVFPRSFFHNFYGGIQDIAELGFIVVRIDGMGTYGRSKAFHDVSYKNMDQNLLDHVLAIRQLGERYAWVDTTRVGIFGHSAGGYDAAHGVLEFPDFYQVGVASSADHDFRMEKAWWPEMYMGWPVDSTYHEVSNITMAGNLKGRLLITHGGLDENVNPSATFKLAEALIRANKQFDMLIIPSQHHGYRGQYYDYFRRLRLNYFVEHLLGAEPIWDVEDQ